MCLLAAATALYCFNAKYNYRYFTHSFYVLCSAFILRFILSIHFVQYCWENINYNRIHSSTRRSPGTIFVVSFFFTLQFSCCLKKNIKNNNKYFRRSTWERSPSKIRTTQHMCLTVQQHTASWLVNAQLFRSCSFVRSFVRLHDVYLVQCFLRRFFVVAAVRNELSTRNWMRTKPKEHMYSHVIFYRFRSNCLKMVKSSKLCSFNVGSTTIFAIEQIQNTNSKIDYALSIHSHESRIKSFVLAVHIFYTQRRLSEKFPSWTKNIECVCVCLNCTILSFN